MFTPNLFVEIISVVALLLLLGIISLLYTALYPLSIRNFRINRLDRKIEDVKVQLILNTKMQKASETPPIDVSKKLEYLQRRLVKLTVLRDQLLKWQ